MDKLYVLIKVEPGHIEGILGSVTQKKYVQEASAVTGSYDIIVKLEGESITQILSTVVKDIHRIPGIASTETLVAVDFNSSY
jgi:DNA-binding Lrp family transcriptional regulator